MKKYTRNELKKFITYVQEKKEVYPTDLLHGKKQTILGNVYSYIHNINFDNCDLTELGPIIIFVSCSFINAKLPERVDKISNNVIAF